MGHVPGLIQENLPGPGELSDGGGKYSINLNKLEVFKGIPEDMIKFITPQAKFALLENALKKEKLTPVRIVF